MEDSEGDVINEIVHCTVSVPKRWITLYCVKSHEAKTRLSAPRQKNWGIFYLRCPCYSTCSAKAKNHNKQSCKLIANLHLFVLR
jgi:hypothetical protein